MNENQHLSSSSLYRSALEMARTGKSDDAERHLRLLLKRHPNHAESLHLLGVVLLESGRPMDAVSIFGQAIALSPQQAQLYYHLGLALLRSGDRENAETAFNSALKLDDNCHDARYNLAKLCKEKGDFDNAADFYKSLLKRVPVHEDALYNLANLYYAMDMLSDAEGLLTRLLAARPDHLNARVNLAMIKNRCGKRAQSVQILEKTLELDPTHKHASDLLRKMYRKMVPSWHFDMLNDEERNNAYAAAIENVARNASHVLDIGTGSGLLAMMAARGGAKKVTTCEMVKPLAMIARKIIEKNGYKDRVRLISKKSTQLQLGEDLDALADVLIAEVFDNGLLGEHFLPALQHAKQNLLTGDAVVVPMAATIHGVLISCPELRRVNPIQQIAGFDISDFDVFRQNGYKQINLRAVGHQKLSEPTAIYHLDFRKEVPKSKKQKISLSIEKSGTCHALAFWYDLHLDQKNTISTLSQSRTNHWKQAIEFFEEDYPLVAGTTIELGINQSHTGFEFELNFPNAIKGTPANGAAV